MHDAQDSLDGAFYTADELVDLVVSKYGKRYDLTIARRSFAGRDFVSLNVMWCVPQLFFLEEQFWLLVLMGDAMSRLECGMLWVYRIDPGRRHSILPGCGMDLHGHELLCCRSLDHRIGVLNSNNANV